MTTSNEPEPMVIEPDKSHGSHSFGVMEMKRDNLKLFCCQGNMVEPLAPSIKIPRLIAGDFKNKLFFSCQPRLHRKNSSNTLRFQWRFFQSHYKYVHWFQIIRPLHEKSPSKGIILHLKTINETVIRQPLLCPSLFISFFYPDLEESRHCLLLYHTPPVSSILVSVPWH